MVRWLWCHVVSHTIDEDAGHCAADVSSKNGKQNGGLHEDDDNDESTTTMMRARKSDD